MIFYAFWNLIFAYLSMISGESTSGVSEYKNINDIAIFYLMEFRNSIGDIKTPVTTLWDKHLSGEMEGNHKSK